jgi:DNA-binding NarL/FixJ family response regulator
MLGSVLIVDDHLGFRAWARQLLETAGYQVSGEAGSGEEAIGEARRLRPDLVLLDVHLPDIDGFEVTRILLDANEPRPRIVLTSSREQVEFGGRITQSGALGFIAKDGLSASTLSALLAGEVLT